MKRWVRALVAAAVALATLVPSAAMAVKPGPSMLHEEATPTASLSGKTVGEKDLSLDSTLHGVYLGGGTHSDDPRGTASRPDDARFTSIPAVRKFLTRVLDASPSSEQKAETGKTSVDGASIDKLALTWDNTTDSTYSIDTSSDSPLTFRARVDFQISGTRDHQPGEVTFTLPLNLFKDRDGNDVGSIDMSVPEDPSSGATFTYQRLDDRIVVRNAQAIPGSYQGYFEFAYTNITPHLITSGKKSDPVTVILKDVGDNDQTAVKTSDPIDAVVTTHEKLTGVVKQGVFSETLPVTANSLPGGFDKSQYWYVDWYGYATVTGNQSYTMSVADTPRSGDDGLIIGTDIPGATISADHKSITSGQVFKGYTPSGNSNFFYHVIMAYPLTEVNTAGDSGSTAADGTIIGKTVSNTLSYTLTPLDSKTAQTVEHEAEVSYRIHPYTVSGTQLTLCKAGPSRYDVSGNTCDKASDTDAENAYGLNKLSQNKDFHTSWRVEGSQFVWGETSSTTANQFDPASFGKYPVDTEILDDDQWLGSSAGSEGTALTKDDIEVTGLDLTAPQMYSYQGTPATGYSYKRDSSVAAPDTTILMKTEDAWKEAARVSFSAGKVSITAKNGAKPADSSLIFPSGVTQWKATYSSTAAGENWTAVAHVTLHPSATVLAKVTKLLASSASASTELNNHASMTITTHRDGKPEKTTPQPRQASQTIGSAAQWASLQKQGQQASVDTKKNLVTLHYTIDSNLKTNIRTRSVSDALMQEGVLPSDQSGRFYDLLPMGMEAVSSSVSVEGGNVTGVQTVDDWRGSGRQMLIVTVKGDRSYWLGTSVVDDKGNYYRRLSFDADYSWGDLKQYGENPVNNAVYVSDTASLGTVKGSISEPDDPSHSNNTASADATEGVASDLTGLEPDNKGKVSTLYASVRTPVDSVTSAFNGLTKQVAVQGSGVWTTGRDKKSDGTVDASQSITVDGGGAYAYRLFVAGDSNSATSGIVLYDNIEAFTPSATDTDQAADVGTATWKGTLLSVDTSALAAKGVKPVVYYRSTPFDTSKAPDLKDGTWSTTRPATVAAIAIDATKKTNGDDYALPKGDVLQAQIRMRAPEGKPAADASANGKKAFNNAWMSETIGGKASWSHNDYTKVGIRPFDVTVTKKWDDGNDRDAKRPGSVTVRLLSNGTDTGRTATLDASNKWTATFENLPKSDEDGKTIAYSATDTVDGYTASADQKLTDGGLAVTLTNTHTPETTTVSGTKRWEGGTVPASLTLHLLADGTDTGKTVTLTNNGTDTWAWSFGKLHKNKNVDGKAVPIVYTVREDKTAGWMPQTVQDGTEQNMADTAGEAYKHAYNSGDTIINKWHPYGTLTLSKSATDTVAANKDAEFTFTLSLVKAGTQTSSGTDGSSSSNKQTPYDTGTYSWTSSDGRSGTIANGKSVTLKAGQTITVKDVPMGEKYSWTETDVKGFSAGTVTDSSGTVPDNDTAAATIENVYRSTGRTSLKATKTLRGRKLGLYQFGFTLSPVTESEDGVGGSVGSAIRTAWNDADGSVAFSALSYSQKDAGKVFWYEMKEQAYTRAGYTTDTSVYRVKVSVSDNGDGTQTAVPTYYSYKDGTLTALAEGTTPSFTNTYTAKGTLPISATKVFIGGDLSTRQFTFQLVKDGTVVSTATTNAAGIAAFPDLTYTQDDAGKTYTYTVREVDDGDTKVVWDTHTETTTVKITDNGDGTLSMRQTFSAASGSASDSASGSTSGSDSGSTSGTASSSAASSTPLVWRNQAGDGSLTVSKHLTSDEATQKKKDTSFPMRVRLAVPSGATLAKTLSGTLHTDASDTAGTAHTWDVKSDAGGNYIDIKVKAGGWVRIDGIPGGTSYLVVEEGE